MLPQEVEHCSLTQLQEKLAKIRANVVRHGRYNTIQLAEAAIPRTLLADNPHLVDCLRPAAGSAPRRFGAARLGGALVPGDQVVGHVVDVR